MKNGGGAGATARAAIFVAVRVAAVKSRGGVRRDNQDENRATIRMRMRGRVGD